MGNLQCMRLRFSLTLGDDVQTNSFWSSHKNARISCRNPSLYDDGVQLKWFNFSTKTWDSSKHTDSSITNLVPMIDSPYNYLEIYMILNDKFDKISDPQRKDSLLSLFCYRKI